MNYVYLMTKNCIKSIRKCSNQHIVRCMSGNSSNKIFGKYKVFKDEDAPIILDVEEERSKIRNVPKNSVRFDKELKYERGVTGVFDVAELVELLKSNKGKEIIVMKIPPELNYVNFMVIVSGLSRRHLVGLAELIRKIFKLKMNSSDIIPHIEGESSDWIALDLGNIAVHIMTVSMRKMYDLESLWAVGATYDIKLNSRENEVVELLKKHSFNLDDLNPVTENS